MPSPSLLDFILQPELRGQLVGLLTFQQNHQLLGLNKKLETDCKTVRLDAKLSYLFQQALTRISPVSHITSFLSPVEQHHIRAITFYVGRTNFGQRCALRSLVYARRRELHDRERKLHVGLEPGVATAAPPAKKARPRLPPPLKKRARVAVQNVAPEPVAEPEPDSDSGDSNYDQTFVRRKPGVVRPHNTF